MTYIDWEIQANEFGNCNCDYGCPCQFNALPTHGNCEAVAGFQFTKGHFGSVNIDGLRAVYIASWPGAVHEGNGQLQIIIDERANEAQREAIRRIMYGEETQPGATMFNVFMSMITTVHDPLYREIQFTVDVDARTARLIVDDIVESRGEPIRNPVTGAEHRVRIDLENGFEYSVAEIGSGSSRSNTAVKMELEGSYGQFASIHLSPYGIVN